MTTSREAEQAALEARKRAEKRKENRASWRR